MISAYINLVVVAAAVATVSMTVARSALFSPLRIWIHRNYPKLGKLIGCPYCFSHWVSIAAALTLDKWLPNIGGYLSTLVNIAALVALSALWCGLIYVAFSQMHSLGEEGDDDAHTEDSR